MSQTTQNSTNPVPKKDLLRGSAYAAGIAGIVLAVAVLPAEYGIDPTGLGKVLGLTGMHSVAATTAPAVMASTTAALPATASSDATAKKASTIAAPGEARAVTIASAQATPYRVDTMEITLPPGRGLEVKTKLAKGATLIYSWKTKGGEVLHHDFHGEPVNAKGDEFESFILENDVSESRGSLIAPFSGVHGWYWKNKSQAPITLVLNASGFYTDLFKK